MHSSMLTLCSDARDRNSTTSDQSDKQATSIQWNGRIVESHLVIDILVEDYKTFYLDISINIDTALLPKTVKEIDFL